MADYICLCQAVLNDNRDYQFCPVCGRRAARLSLPHEWAPPPLKPGRESLRLGLCKEGPGVLPFRVSVQAEGIVLQGHPSDTILDSAPHTITLRAVNGAAREIVGHVRVATPTGDRREAWWEEQVWEEQSLPLRITSRTPAQLEIPAQRILFPANQPRQILCLWNLGQVATRVTLQAPTGFAVIGDDGPATTARVAVPAEGHAEVVVERRPNAAGGTLRAQWDGGEQEVPLEVLQHRAGGFRPDYVVGIDFGSANTSVRLRDLKSGEVMAVGPPDYSGEIPLRFPSVMWLPHHGSAQPLIGQDAVNRYLTDPGAGFLVKGIKTLMRLEENPYQQYGATWTTHRLLALYMRCLKALIDERTQACGIEDRGNILYVFCLPVLDAGQQYEAQKDRMRRAAVEADFPADDDDLTWFLEEPVAAALAVVRDVQQREGLAPDTHFCVVDAGGSTTDVTLGQVYLDRQNRYRFRPEKTFALHFEVPEGSRRLQYRRLWRLQGVEQSDAEREVGGQMIDRLLAAEWMRPGGKLPSEPWESLWAEEAYSGAAEPRPDLDRRVWSVLNAVETLKQCMCDAPDERLVVSQENIWEYFLHHADTPFVQDRLQQHAGTWLPAPVGFTHGADIRLLMTELWRGERMGPILREIVTQYDGQIQGVALVGGGNHVPAQQEEIRHWSGVPIIEVGMERTLLVIDGSVFAFDLAPAGALDRAVVLEIEHGDSTKRMEILSPYRRAQSLRPMQRTYELLADDRLRVTVKTRDQQGAEIPVATCSLSARFRDEVNVIARCDPGGALRVALRRNGVALPLWEIQL